MLKLDLEIKGVLAKKISDIFSWEKIELLAMSVGVNPDSYEGLGSKRKVAKHIVESIPKGNEEQLLTTTVTMAKKGSYDADQSKEVISALNPVLERLQNCRIDENGKIFPIFDPSLKLEAKKTLIGKRLQELGLTKALEHYMGALATYRTNAKGALSLLRSCYEMLVEESLIKLGAEVPTNQKDRLTKLQDLGIIATIDTAE